MGIIKNMFIITFIIITIIFMVTTIDVCRNYKYSLKHIKEQEVIINELTQENKIFKNALKALQGSTPGIYKPHIQQIVYSTLLYLGEKNINSWNKLLCLTIATESDMGKYSRQLKGPARGITQVEPSTEQTAMRWIAKKDKKLYEKIKNLRIPAKLSIHEAEYNLSYSIALAYIVYKMRNVNPVKKSITELTQLYKTHYNTVKGKATTIKAISKFVAYGGIDYKN